MDTTEKIGRCHDCTAPQTEVNILSRHILELQADKGRLTDRVRELTEQNTSLLTSVENLNKSVQELEAQKEKMKEVISELIAITDKDICKECDGSIHCSECYVNHAQSYANHFINEKEIKEK